jgi:outer membrane protein W
MKKTIVLSVLALTVCCAKGQTTKNNWFVGGGFAFTSASQKESGTPGSTNSTAFLITPNAGYFFIDNLAAGFNLNLNSTHNSDNGGISATGIYFTAGPLARYYFNIAPTVKLFVHADASWGSSKETYSSSSAGITFQNQPSAPISIYEGKAGAAFFLTPNVALEFTAGYQSLTEKDNSGGEIEKFTTGSIIVGIGFQVYLGPAKHKK